MSQIVTDQWDSLRARLQAFAGSLRCQGTLVEKTIAGHRYWYVRFYLTKEGKRVQKAVYVGAAPELIERARQYLEELRQEEREYRHLKHLLPGVRRLIRWVSKRTRRTPHAQACDPCPREGQAGQSALE